MSAAYILIGPAPFLDGLLSNSVNLSFGVAAMFGVSWSLVAVSSFTRASRVAMRLGYCDDMNTNLNLAGEFEHLLLGVQFNIYCGQSFSSLALLIPPGQLPRPHHLGLRC